jgi:hypothetical protein
LSVAIITGIIKGIPVNKDSVADFSCIIPKEADKNKTVCIAVVPLKRNNKPSDNEKKSILNQTAKKTENNMAVKKLIPHA